MILVIDTSSSVTARLALIGEDGRSQSFSTSRDHRTITNAARGLIAGKKLTGVAVATGPGSFTGLRVGVAFGLGLAIGLGIPIIPLGSLDLWAAQSEAPATAVLDAGRGRVYFKAPGSEPALGTPSDVPLSHPLIGDVPPLMEEKLVAAGHRFVPTPPPERFYEAAQKLLETALEVPYRNLEIEYMHSFSAKP